MSNAGQRHPGAVAQLSDLNPLWGPAPPPQPPPVCLQQVVTLALVVRLLSTLLVRVLTWPLCTLMSTRMLRRLWPWWRRRDASA